MKKSLVVLIIMFFVAGMATGVQAESVNSIGDCLSLYTNGTEAGMEFEWVVEVTGNSFTYEIFHACPSVQLDNFNCTDGMKRVGFEQYGFGYYYIQINAETRSILCVSADLFESGTEVISQNGLVFVSNMETRWYTPTMCDPTGHPLVVPTDDMLVNIKPLCDPQLGPPEVPSDDDLVNIIDQIIYEEDENEYPIGIVYDPWIGYPSQPVRKPVDVM